MGNEDLLDGAGKAPVIKLVNLVLFEAVSRQASDVHVQPYDEKLLVRMRIDGVLHDVLAPPKGLQNEIISRIKVMGQMNIAERRIAQDGRATVEVGLTGVGMDQIWSMTAVLNLPSQAVMRRIGMTFYSHFDHPAVEIGHAVRPHVAFLIRRPGIRAGIRAGGSPAFVGGR